MVNRPIRLADPHGRDATVWIIPVQPSKKAIHRFAEDRPVQVIRRLKVTPETQMASIREQYPDPDALSRKLIEEDPEIDVDLAGMAVGPCDRVFLDSQGQPVYDPEFLEIRMDETGKETDRRPWQARPSNLVPGHPPVWSHFMLAQDDAVRTMGFTRLYQVIPGNALEFDFLFGIAAYLEEQNAMVQVGSGKDGRGPLILERGGYPYRGFLDGRTRNGAFRLVLYLASFPLKMPRADL